MAGDTANPRLWLLGDVYYAPVGTVAPTNTTTAFSASWDYLGLLSEDGLTETRSQESNDYYAWGGILIRTVRTKFKRSFKVAALEDNSNVFYLLNPGSTVAIAGAVTTRTVKTPTANPMAFAFEVKDGTITKRIIIPRGEIVEIGDVVYSENDINQREITIDVYPSAAGVLYTELTDDPAAEAAS